MFKSKRRPVVIPQSEHLKLAGTLAFLWGNERFELPPIPKESFTAGVGLHDRGYGYLDRLPVGEADEEAWLAVTRRGFYMPCSDPTADVITRMHLKRLVSWDTSPARHLLLKEMEAVIEAQLGEHGLTQETFERIDCLTDFCDRVSFDFCFEEPVERNLSVFQRNEDEGKVALKYQVRESEIIIDPWPLGVEAYSGYLVGYQAEGYPDHLEGVVVPFILRGRKLG